MRNENMRKQVTSKSDAGLTTKSDSGNGREREVRTREAVAVESSHAFVRGALRKPKGPTQSISGGGREGRIASLCLSCRICLAFYN